MELKKTILILIGLFFGGLAIFTIYAGYYRYTFGFGFVSVLMLYLLKYRLNDWK